MEIKKNGSSTMLVSVLISINMYAHAGSYDRWLQRKTSILACSSTVIPVMVILGLLFLVLLRKSRMNRCTLRFCTAVSKYQILSTIFFWLLLSFFLTPLYSFLSAVSHEGILLTVMMATWVLCFFKWARRYCVDASLNNFMLNMAACQAIGYFVYSMVVRCDFFQQLFRFTDEEYQLADFYLYPEIKGISICCSNICDILLISAFPFVVCLIYAVRDVCRRKRQQA